MVIYSLMVNFPKPREKCSRDFKALGGIGLSHSVQLAMGCLQCNSVCEPFTYININIIYIFIKFSYSFRLYLILKVECIRYISL